MHPGTVLGLPRVPQGITPLAIFRQRLELNLRSDKLVGLSGSDVLTWGDLSWKGHNFTAPVGNRPTYNLADANWGGKPSVVFGAASQWLASDDVAGVWKFLHDGTGGFFLIVYRFGVAFTATLIANMANNLEVGVRFRSPQSANQRLAIANGSGSFGVNNSIPAAVVNTNYYGYYAYEEGRPVNEFINAVLTDESTGNSIVAPSAVDPTFVLRIGASPTGSQDFEGEMLEVIAASVYPTAQQFIYLKAYLLIRYGLA